jgi:hypothetical protein
LSELLEKLEVDRKTYEDLEFHYLEEETEWWVNSQEFYHSHLKLQARKPESN